MRIGIDLSVIQTTKSGVDWYTHHVIIELMGLLAPDEELYLFTNRETGFEKEAAGFPRVKVITSTFRFQEPWRQFVLPWLLRKHRIDVCFFTNFVLSVAALCPMVLTIHDLSFKLFPRTHSLRNVVWARSLVPISTRRASRIIADSNNTKLDLLRVMNVPDQKVSVVHLGVSGYSPDPQPGDEEALMHYGIFKPYTLYVGTLEPRKNLTMLIKAFDKVVKSGSDAHLVLAGRRGWMAQAIFDELERRDLIGRIHITGYVHEEHLPALYRNATVFIYPSLYEGFGLPPLEAMSSGTPVIVSRNSSLPEVVGDAGIYVNALDADDLAQAMESVINNPELARSLREKGLERAEQFSWKKTAERTLDIIREAARV
jgi:glycosyltransferase involved in cell wall biosynthesis